jgi:Zn ribbon nucleic-acid-binding protein
MDDETREKIRDANRRRRLCPRCGHEPREVDGSQIGGLPGITYRTCGACGWSQAKTKRQPRRL